MCFIINYYNVCIQYIQEHKRPQKRKLDISTDNLLQGTIRFAASTSV